MIFSEAYDFSGDSLDRVAHMINNMQTGIWEYDPATKKTTWNVGFYTMLGYAPGEIECSYNNFIDDVLYHGDRKIFLRSTAFTAAEKPAAVHVRLLTKSSGYQWFESTAQVFNSAAGPILCGAFNNIHNLKIAQVKAQQDKESYAETGRIAKIGRWEIDKAKMELHLSCDIYDIFELNNKVQLSVEEAISFFEPAYRPVITDAIENALRHCKPYDVELQLRTAKNNVIWVRSKGFTIVNDLGQCVSVRGIFQDIDKIKKRGLTMQSSINLLDDQNKRLQNFAYIVSHNLRSHTGNLKLMVSLFEEAQHQHERDDMFSHIKTISNSLNLTISHLDEIVKIQTDVTHGRKTVYIDRIFNNVIAALQTNITATRARISVNFDACHEVHYVPAYLESIVQNLLTNALKYKHPHRDPVISCYTEKTDGSIYLIVEDNGIGIDLQRHGDDIFGLYKTFHNNNDAKGIGLFITRNQVEALGGSIHIDSTLGAGTRFTIKLA